MLWLYLNSELPVLNIVPDKYHYLATAQRYGDHPRIVATHFQTASICFEQTRPIILLVSSKLTPTHKERWYK